MAKKDNKHGKRISSKHEASKKSHKHVKKLSRGERNHADYVASR